MIDTTAIQASMYSTIGNHKLDYQTLHLRIFSKKNIEKRTLGSHKITGKMSD